MPGSKIEEKAHGFEMTLPEDWKSKRMQTGYVFGHPDYRGLMLLLYHNSRSLEEMKEEMYAGFYDENGFSIQVDGQIKEINEQMILADYSGTAEGVPAQGFGIALLSPFGGGILICAITSKQEFKDEHMDTVEDMAMSISFFEPESGDSSKEWSLFLSGKRLVKMGDSTSMNSFQIDLFDNGSFQQNKNKPVIISETPNNEASTRGKWEIIIVMEQPILRLSFFDSSERQFILEYDEEILFLNHEPWKILNSDIF